MFFAEPYVPRQFDDLRALEPRRMMMLR